MLRLMRQPRWIVGAIVALLLVVLFVNFGLWQLRRLDQRREFNAATESALQAPRVTVAELAVGSVPIDEYRTATADGFYEEGAEGVLELQSRLGQAGVHGLAALRMADGSVVAIDRGWLELDAPLPPVPEGVVILEGRVRLPKGGGRLTDPGPPPRIDRVDLDLLGEVWNTELAPFFLEVSQGEDTAFAPHEPLELTNGPHFGYAMQWFAFAAIGLIGFPLLLRREASRVR